MKYINFNNVKHRLLIALDAEGLITPWLLTAKSQTKNHTVIYFEFEQKKFKNTKLNMYYFNRVAFLQTSELDNKTTAGRRISINFRLTDGSYELLQLNINLNSERPRAIKFYLAGHKWPADHSLRIPVL